MPSNSPISGELLHTLFVAQAFGRAPAGGGGGFGFGGGAPPVATGDYLVTITIDGKTLSRVLRVERGK